MGAAEMLREMAKQEFREELARFQDDELEFMLHARIKALQSRFCTYQRLKKKEIRNAKRTVKA